MITLRNKITLLLLLATSVAMGQITPFYSASVLKYGYKNAQGEVLVAPQFDLAYGLNEGMATVKRDGKYGYLNSNGEMVIPPRYDKTWKFIGGFAAVELNGKVGFIDMKGREIVPLIYQAGYNHHGACCYKQTAHVKENGIWRIIPLK